MTTRIDPAPVPELAEESARALVEIRRRKRLPWAVAAVVGIISLAVIVALLIPTTSGLTEKLADVCTAAGPNVPADATVECAQAQRGEVPAAVAGVPGLDGAVTETPVTVPPDRPGAPATVIYPPGPGPLPGAAGVAPVAPPPVTVAAPPVTVTSGVPVPAQLQPRETVTLAAPPPETVTEAAPPETVTEAAPPETVTETVVEQPAPETSTTTVTETVTVTAEPGTPTEAPPSEAPPAEPEGPVTTSGDPSPAPSPTEEPLPVLPPSPVASVAPEDEESFLVRLLSFGFGM